MRAVYPVCGRCLREVHACVCRRVREAHRVAIAVIAALALDALSIPTGGWR